MCEKPGGFSLYYMLVVFYVLVDSQGCSNYEDTAWVITSSREHGVLS